MADRMLNVLINSFSGLGLPPTLALQLPVDSSIEDLVLQVAERVPSNLSIFSLTTNSNKSLNATNTSLSTLLRNEHDDFLPLRLSVPLRGGKGGFGSQLRAAGGRMSSKKKKNQGDANSSNRNLDGRRLRTINEAKALAEYLALKPDMERKEKEARRKRWEQVVELAERREEEARNGTKGRVDGKWVEDKEEAGERAREAALAAVLSGQYHDNLQEQPPPPPSQSKKPQSSSNTSGSEDDDDLDQDSVEQGQGPSVSKPVVSGPLRTFAGFDEDDEFMSDTDASEADSGDEASDPSSHQTRGKGKGKA